jgi:hypothetical protein
MEIAAHATVPIAIAFDVGNFDRCHLPIVP